MILVTAISAPDYGVDMSVINLTHNAYDRSIYSEGALHAAQWLTKKRPGYYSMRDVLNI